MLNHINTVKPQHCKSNKSFTHSLSTKSSWGLFLSKKLWQDYGGAEDQFHNLGVERQPLYPLSHATHYIQNSGSKRQIIRQNIQYWLTCQLEVHIWGFLKTSSQLQSHGLCSLWPLVPHTLGSHRMSKSSFQDQSFLQNRSLPVETENRKLVSTEGIKYHLQFEILPYHFNITFCIE